MLDKSFQETLITAIENKGISLPKLSEQSRLPERYLEALLRGDYSSLPAAPYLHGYITRLAHVLELDAVPLWQIFKKEYQAKTSGRDDRLPPNRFALEAGNNAWLIMSVIISLILVGYITVRFNDLLGRPDLSISNPATDTTTTDTMFYTITGTTNLENKLTINNESVEISPDGHFAKDVLLENGLNSFAIKSSKFLGQSTTIRRQIIYQPDTATSDHAPSSTAPTASSTLETTSP